MRSKLADRFGADITCPMTTRKCVQVVAEAANEAAQNVPQSDDVTPIWRAANWSGSMFKRLSFNPVFIVEQREHERI